MEKCIGTKFFMDDKVLPASCFQEYFVEKGHSIYEVIRIIKGVPLFAEKHITRLLNSAAHSNMTFSFSYDHIMKRIYALISLNETETGNVKLLLHHFRDKYSTGIHWYTYFIPYHYPSKKDYKEGISVILIRAERTNPNVKAVNTNMRSSIDSKLKERGAYEALLVDAHGNITEGSRSNVFFLRNSELLTATQDRILPGITRDAILEICKMLHYQVIEKNVPQEHLHLMEAVFISGTSPKVLPVQRIDNFGFESASHPVVKDIMIAYDQLIDNYIKSNKHDHPSK